ELREGLAGRDLLDTGHVEVRDLAGTLQSNLGLVPRSDRPRDRDALDDRPLRDGLRAKLRLRGRSVRTGYEDRAARHYSDQGDGEDPTWPRHQHSSKHGHRISP